MSVLTNQAITELNQARMELLTIPLESMRMGHVQAWYERWKESFSRTESITGASVHANFLRRINGFANVVDPAILGEVRVRVVELLDGVIKNLDGHQRVRPLIEDLILRVKNTKLHTLLQEFNSVRETCPNLAALGFRTILSLIFAEKAKLTNPEGELARLKDISFDRDLKQAIHEGLFTEADDKLLRRYMGGGNKDIFDNVAHKPETTIEKEDLEDAVDLLNRLLPYIVKGAPGSSEVKRGQQTSQTRQ